MKPEDRKIAEGILFTDQYQLTMAQLYYRMGLHEKLVQFEHFFRDYPDYGSHKAGYCINAGLEWLLSWMGEVRFGDRELDYMRAQTGQSGGRLFADDFLDWLKKHGNFDGVRIRAIPEGRVVHPLVPITVVHGPLVMAQILESPLLNQLNYQTLIATKAARIREAACGKSVLEFGLRRAQNKGANAGTRAALIGGADFTSNVGISHILGYPPKGTHAHSMVQVFMAAGGSELDAFRAYSEVYPDDCLLLVDTIDTLQSGLPNAIKVFEKLRRKGHEPVGIRLDSGDLAYLGIQAARMLNDAGFPRARIVLSNQLDEMVIWQIVTQIRDEASISGVDPHELIDRLIFGVGTSLVTSGGSAALDGVCKLSAVYNENRWQPAIKVSESPAKTINPGIKHAWRIYDRRGKAIADLLSLEREDPRRMDKILLRHPTQEKKYRSLRQDDISDIEPLLKDVRDEGGKVSGRQSIDEMRALRLSDVDRLDQGVKRLVNPHIYHVSLTGGLWDFKQELIRTNLNNIIRQD